MLVLLVGPLTARAIQNDTRVLLNDNSDWWSASRSLDSDTSLRIREGEASELNFSVLGIKLDFDMFDGAAAEFGKATIVERGDAATGRQQACYVSADRANKIYIVFEQGELDLTYYLFAEGPDWSGEDRCVPSNLINRNTATASGVRLGESSSQVIGVLGQPSKRRKNELFFRFTSGRRPLLRSFENSASDIPN
jgi:hypothetical protein